ncbi:hypothetical protein U1Q18_046214, partial [Sarracenia purpurea var. burkii]
DSPSTDDLCKELRFATPVKGNNNPVWVKKRSTFGGDIKVEDGKSGVVEPVGGIANLGFPSFPLPIGDRSGLEIVRDQGDDNVGKGSISEEGTKSDYEEVVLEDDDLGAVDDSRAGDCDDEVEEFETGLTKKGAAREGSDVSVSWDRGKASEDGLNMKETEVARALPSSDGKLKSGDSIPNNVCGSLNGTEVELENVDSRYGLEEKQTVVRREQGNHEHQVFDEMHEPLLGRFMVPGSVPKASSIRNCSKEGVLRGTPVSVMKAQSVACSGAEGSILKSQNMKISLEGSTEVVKPNLQDDQGAKMVLAMRTKLSWNTLGRVL